MPHLNNLSKEGRFDKKVWAVLEDLNRHGFNPVIASSLRTEKEQRELVRKGYSRTMKSKHLPGRDGKCRAADIVPKVTYWNAPKSFWLKLGASALAHGLKWGGLFGLSRSQRAVLVAALKAPSKNWIELEQMKIGWDPAHVEI